MYEIWDESFFFPSIVSNLHVRSNANHELVIFD